MPNQHKRLCLFALPSLEGLGEQVASKAELELGSWDMRQFEGGEHKMRPKTDVRGRPVAVLAGLFASKEESVNDRLVQTLFFLAALKDSGATNLHLLLPYLCYSRKDRRSHFQDPVSSRYIAQLFEAMGVTSLTTLEVHNLVAFENAFRCPTQHIRVDQVFVPHLAPLLKGTEAVVASPDVGGIKRAEEFRRRLERECAKEFGKAFMEKRRRDGQVSGDMLVGDVTDKTVILVDDMISSGGTMMRAAKACRAGGAKEVWLVAAHGLFDKGSEENLVDNSVSQIWLSDTVPMPRMLPEKLRHKVCYVKTANLWVKALTSAL